MVDIPIGEPCEIVAGDTVKWTAPDDSSYPIADSWLLTYALTGPQKITINSTEITPTTAGHQVVIPATMSAVWAAGTYRWAAYLTLSGERYQVRNGVIEILPNLATIEPDTTLEDQLDVIETAIASVGTGGGVRSFQINGRGVEFDREGLEKQRVILISAIQQRDNPGPFLGRNKVQFVTTR